MYYLYYLLDPLSNEVRYIGITNNPKRRFKEHIYSSKLLKSHKDKWIKSLIKKDLLPIQKIICETSTKNEIILKEIEAIKQYTNLTNSTSGGDYFTFDETVLKKLRELNKGKNNPCYGKVWTKKEREKLSKVRKGRKLSESWKDNLRKSAKNRIPVVINGINYESIKQASIKLNLHYDKIKKLI